MARILVALSGGVDSSAAAAILLDQGHDVETCTFVMRGVGDAARDSARSVARYLNIPHHEFDISREFDDRIIAYFINEYRRGRTPNPCVICNREIKLDALMRKARDLSCTNVATGHYAHVQERIGRYVLTRGADRNEQSYFLYRLQQEHLRALLLPLGDMTRREVEDYAVKRGLPSARRRKSQDVCFVTGNDYPGFLDGYLTLKPGPVLDKQGDILGEHQGIAAYTIGQRHGLGISARRPFYVMRIDAERNVIIVGEKEDLYGSQLTAGDLNFIPFDALTTKIEVQAKPRYVSTPSPAIVEPVSGTEVKVVFARPQWALTPGQSVVFYRDDMLVGGGVIQNTG